MYEKEIQFITDFSLNKVKKFGAFVIFEKLFEADLHPAIIQYISAELDFLIYEDRKKLLEKSSFDYSGSKIAEYFNLIGQEIKRTKKISRENLQKIIVQAVSFNANITVRPKWSLIQLIYGESESKEVHEIKLGLNYIYYYKYLRDVLLTYIRRRGVIALSKGEFELLIDKIDKELFSAQGEKIVDDALSSITDFYNEGGISRKSIPIPLIETFLIEKNLPDYLSRLRNAASVAAKNKMEIEELRKILFLTSVTEKEEEISESEIAGRKEEPMPPDISMETEEKESKPEIIEDKSEMIEIDEEEISADVTSSEVDVKTLESELEIERKEADEEPGTLPGSDEEEEITSDEEEIKFDISEQDKLETLYDFEEGDQERTVENIEEIEEEEITPTREKKEKINGDEILGIEEDSQSDAEESKIEEISEDNTDISPASRSRDKDIFSFLNNKEIEKIISLIFNEDREDFAYTMERISECRTYNESTEILKAVFLSYRVSPYSKEAVLLTNAVANYFDQG
jgi:hypothetical protein